MPRRAGPTLHVDAEIGNDHRELLVLGLLLEDDERRHDVETCLDHRRELPREDLEGLGLDLLDGDAAGFCAESWAESSVASSPRTRNASRAAERSGALISPLDSRPVALMAVYANDAMGHGIGSDGSSLECEGRHADEGTVATPRRLGFSRCRTEQGFGMIELVAAMTIMLIGVLAVFTLFQAGIVHLRRATTVTTAGALADAEMERFRAGRHETLGLDASEVAALVTAENPDVYAADEAYAPGTATTTVTGGLTSTATTLTVAGWSGFPASPEFRVTIDSEVLIISAGAGTTTWTVERGGDGTSPRPTPQVPPSR